MNVFLVLLSKIRLLPYLTPLETSDLEDLVANEGFQMVETESLEDTPPNYFIVAKKPA